MDVTAPELPVPGPCSAPEAAPGLPAEQVVVDAWPHPLTAEGRVTGHAPAGTSLGRIVADALPGLPARAAVDGELVPAGDWEATVPAPGAIVTVRAAVQGDDSDPIRTVLSLALLVAAPFYGPAVGTALGLSGATAAAVGSALITVGGTLVINALVPPAVQAGPGDREREDPVYSLTAGANRDRRYQPLLLVLGEHRVFPDLGAREYAQVDGDDQYLSQILHFGLGNVEISDVRIGETAIGNFDDVRTQTAGPDGVINLVAGNVDTVAGAALADTGWVTRSTADDTITLEVEFTARLFRVDNRGDPEEATAEVRIEHRRRGTAAWSGRTVTLRNDSQSILRHSESFDVASGIHDVRVRRTADPSDENREFDEIAWSALRAWQADDGVYTGQVRYAVRIRASDQLHGRLNRLSALVRQRVPAWDGNAWVVEATSNPAWLFRWFARGIYADGRLQAGCGLAGERIDDEVIKAWGAWCEANQLRCDLVLVGQERRRTTLTAIARCGRASVSWSTGKLGVVWDAGGREASASVTPGNVVAGTMEVIYAGGKPAEEVAVRYIEPDLDWQWNTIRRLMPGVTGAPASTATLTLRGVTQRRQAAEEVNLQAARQLYHRRRLVWQMGPAAHDLDRGDVVQVSHSLLSGGATGRVRGGTAARLDLGAEVALTGADELLLELPDGALHTSRITHPDGPGAGAPTREVLLLTPLPARPGDDVTEPEDILWRHYDVGSPPDKARIVARRPIDATRVRVEAIDEVDAYYQAATSDLTVDLGVHLSHVPRVVAHRIVELRVPAGGGWVTMLELVLTVRGDWQGAVIRAGPDGAPVVPVATLTGGATAARWVAEPGAMLVVTVTPGTETGATGPVYRFTHNIPDGLVPPAAPTACAVEGYADGTRRYHFTPPRDRDFAGVHIRYRPGRHAAPDWDTMTPLHQGELLASPWESIDPPAGEHTFLFRALDHGGALSEGVRIVETLGDQRVDGQRWIVRAGPPTDDLGRDGDLYLDTSSHLIYRKAAGAWTQIADLAGADGAQWHTGDDPPATATGVDGDFYFEEGTATIWQKAAGTWARIVDINGEDGSVWHSGALPPGAALGRVTDWYFQTSNGYVWEKTGEATWTFRRDITGPQGIGGATWHTGAGGPGTSLGNDGDLYLQASNNTVWRKAGGRWAQIADLSGADGAQWYSGSRAPGGSLGDVGDWYFRTGSGAVAAQIYRKTGSSTWTLQVDIDQGDDGAVWLSGSGAPSGSLGSVGDWYFRTSNGYVYEKTSSFAWTFRRDITGPKGDKGDPGDAASLTDGSVQTGHIALSATAEIRAAALTSLSRIGGASGWATILSLSAPGGSGYNYLVTASADANQGLGFRITRAGSGVATDSAALGGNDNNRGRFLAASGAHPATATFRLQHRRVSGDTRIATARAALTVAIAKR